MILINRPLQPGSNSYIQILMKYLGQILTKSKLTAFIILFSCIQVYAAAFSQKVTINAKDMALAQVFTLIKKQTGYHFLYNSNLLKNTTPVTIKLKDASIDETLEKALADQPLNYVIKDDNIIISERKTTSVSTSANQISKEIILIKGTVYEEDIQGKRSPFPGVSIKEKDGSASTTTDGDGQFSIRVNEGAILVFSAIGNKSQQVKVSKANSSLRITMESSQTNLKDVVITGFNNVNKKTFSGAATKLKASEIKQDGVVDISRMLEGRVAGVSVQNVSGTFGSAPKIRVRGATSITGDNKPLWVVDGVILEDVVNVTNDQLSSGDPSTLFGSSVAGLSSEDIESFEILKDAAATSYYGAKAMNGVIVVTTKKGRIGKPVISYSGNFSVSMKPSYSNYNIMNSNEQLSVYMS